MSTEQPLQGKPADGRGHTEVLARRYVRDIVRDRNLVAVEELFAHPSEWESVSLVGGETVETYDELRRYYRQALPSFAEVTVESVVADGATAMVRWSATGEVSEAFPGVPVAGTTFETTAVTEFGFAEGRITSLSVHVNEMDLLPDVSWAAVQGLVEEMRDGVVVLDEQDRIVHVNPAALDLFDREREALLGEPAAALFGEGNCDPGEECSVAVTDAGRQVSVGTSPLSGENGESLGRMVVVRDVTERRRRVQQLDVLNRVLRHNLRNALQVVQARLDMASERADESVASQLHPAREQVEQLQSRAETARHAQAVLDDMESDRQDLGAVASSAVERARERYPSATLSLSVGAATVEAPDAIADALWELVKNACEHAGASPHVAVEVAVDGEDVVVTVTDDGPGLPAHERTALAAGRETDLDHTSGVGLWLVTWVVEASGGSLGFDVEDGTTARATLPRAGS